MRIAQLTPGTGSFHCGSCLRDQALVHGLRELGHEVFLVPLYLPLVLDQEEPEQCPIFFGGVNVYLQQQSALFRATPRFFDKALDRPGVLSWASKRAGMATAADVGPLTVSMLKGEDGRQSKELKRLVDYLVELRPDVVSLSNSMLLGFAKELKSRCRAPVICSLQGEHGFLDDLPEPHREEAWALVRERAQAVDAFLAPSRYYADLMTKRLEVDRERVHVAVNGVELSDIAPAAELPDPPVVGFLARMCPEKGLDRLVEAFCALRRGDAVPGLRLRIAGARTAADEPFVGALLQQVEDAGLRDAVDVLPNVTRAEKLAFLQSISVLCVPALYGEAFGLYLLEALAAGVPFVQPRDGAFPELLKLLGGGALYDPDAERGLEEALATMLAEPSRMRALGQEGQAAVLAAHSPLAFARRVESLFQEACGTRSSKPKGPKDVALLQLSEVCKRFPGPRGGADVEVLGGVDLRLDAGEALVIVGPSGSGKSTLLNIAGLLDPPTSGAVRFGGRDLARLDEPARARHRNEEVGFIFQAHHLLPQLTALENVLLPTLATGRSTDDHTARARTLLERVGLGGRLHHRPGELSGGECQRVAVCRALIGRPRLLLADEPTGSLDRAASEALMTLLDELNREEGTALIVVTHAPSVVGLFARVLELRDGVLGALAPVAVEPLAVEPTS